MTVGLLTVSIQVAVPRGVTADALRTRMVELLAETLVPEKDVVEFEVTTIIVNADPFSPPYSASTDYTHHNGACRIGRG